VGGDKNVIEQLVDKINDAVENMATTASEALQHAMEPEPEKPGGRSVALMPMAGGGDGLLAETAVPPVVMTPRRKKSTSKQAPKKPAKRAAKKAAKKTAKKSSATNKKAGKARKPAAGRKAVAKKKTIKKATKKAKRSRKM
jgi:Glu-tRNA(Gln) amidotransferase subunit E-like FAD-binding protein